MNTPLMKCILHNKPSRMKNLLNQGEDPNEFPYFHLALSIGGIEMAEMLWDYGADIEDVEEATALTRAAAWEPIPLMLRLFDAGQDIDGNTYATPLGHAAGYGSFEAVQWLLSRGADVDRRTAYDVTPLMAAAYWGHPEIIRYLLAWGADPLRVHESGMTAADFARLPWHQDDEIDCFGSSGTPDDKGEAARILG